MGNTVNIFDTRRAYVLKLEEELQFLIYTKDQYNSKELAKVSERIHFIQLELRKYRK